MRQAVWWLVALFAASPAVAGKIIVVPFGDAAHDVAPAVRAAISGKTVLDAGTTDEDVKGAADTGIACGAASDECLVKLALFAQVDQLISLSAVPTERGLELDLILIDAALTRRTGAVHGLNVEDAVAELLTPDKVFGALTVTTTPAGAHVSIDGALVGTRTTRLRAGPHDVVASLTGFTPAQTRVDVKPGTETPLALSLAPLVKPKAKSQPGPLVAVAGGVVLAAAGTTAIVIDTLLTNTGTGDFSSRDAMLTVERAAAGVAVVGGVVGAVGLAMILSE